YSPSCPLAPPRKTRARIAWNDLSLPRLSSVTRPSNAASGTSHAFSDSFDHRTLRAPTAYRGLSAFCTDRASRTSTTRPLLDLEAVYQVFSNFCSQLPSPVGQQRRLCYSQWAPTHTQYPRLDSWRSVCTERP